MMKICILMSVFGGVSFSTERGCFFRGNGIALLSFAPMTWLVL